MASRPRGGDWLADEITSWQSAGVGIVLSLLTAEEEGTLELQREEATVKGLGMDFLSLPIEDRQVPGSETEVAATVERLNARLRSGGNAVIHCRQGVGRSGLIAACLLVSRGMDSAAAVQRVSAARGVAVPETTGQRHWIDHYAATLASQR